MNRIQKKEVKLAKLAIKFAENIRSEKVYTPIKRMIKSIKQYYNKGYKEFEYELFLNNEIDTFRSYLR